MWVENMEMLRMKNMIGMHLESSSRLVYTQLRAVNIDQTTAAVHLTFE